MAKWPKSATIVLAADALVTTHPCWLHSALILASAAGGDASIYEGQDTSSGRQIVPLKGPANESVQAVFDPPIWCERGLYLDVGSSITSVTLHYTVQSLNRPEGD